MSKHSELDEQVKEFALDIWHLALDEGYGTAERRAELVTNREGEFKQALIDWHNKQTEKDVSADEFLFLNHLVRNGYVDRERDAKELEDALNKLKESKQ